MAINVGDIVTYRRIQVNPEAAITGGPAYDWVEDVGVVVHVSDRRERLGDSPCHEVNPVDYLIRIHFQQRELIRTIRFSQFATRGEVIGRVN